MVGGITSGFLVRSVPYWFLLATALAFNIIAFIIYSLTYQGWLLIISRLLTGCFLGAILTLAFSYFTMSSQAYYKVKKELGKEIDEKSAFKLRNYLFATMSVSQTAGLLIGSGKYDTLFDSIIQNAFWSRLPNHYRIIGNFRWVKFKFASGLEKFSWSDSWNAQLRNIWDHEGRFRELNSG